MKKEKGINWNIKDILSFFISKKFFINLGFILLLILVLFFFLKQGLRAFTHHGEKLRMPDYINMPLNTAREDASDRTFNIVVTDSIFIVDKPGNIILNQNPKPDAYVKEDRTIYVTITKSQAETVMVKDLPRLYGENFDLKSQELKLGFMIESEIVGRQYDPGPEGHILLVMDHGDTIVSAAGRRNDVVLEKGQTLQFILSKQSGGVVSIPKLRCRTYSAAEFLASSYGLELKADKETAGLLEGSAAYVNYQNPRYDPAGTIRMGDTITVHLTPTLPENCTLNDTE